MAQKPSGRRISCLENSCMTVTICFLSPPYIIGCSLVTQPNSGSIPSMLAQRRSIAGSWKALHVLASAARDLRDHLLLFSWFTCSNMTSSTSGTRRARCCCIVLASVNVRRMEWNRVSRFRSLSEPHLASS